MLMKHSIIIPYQHSKERLPLLHACLESIVNSSNNQFEICIHEIGLKKELTLPSKYKYLYTEFGGIFHRAWALNRGVKELSTGDYIVLMDGDLIVNHQWAEQILSCTVPSVGWDRLSILNASGTKHYLKTKHIDRSKIERTKTPSMGRAAGAVTVIPRDTYFQVGGIPEDFAGSWGGEDNAFWTKMIKLGYKFSRVKGEILHLNHTHSTPRVYNIQRKVFPMFHWKRHQWNRYISHVANNWGLKNPKKASTPSPDYISSVGSPKLTFAMLSWLRYDRLIETLKSLKDTLTVPVNIVIMVQGSERLSKHQRRTIRELAFNFHSSDVFFTKGNIGTGPARAALIKRTLNRFHSSYINFADDDTTYSKGSIEAAIELLDSDPSIGIVGIRYKPRIYKLNSHINPTVLEASNAETSLEYVDCTGSASAIIRREVFDLCKVDPYYSIGQWDLDLFLQARSIGWKIVNYQAFRGMKANNNWGGDAEYKAARLNRRGILRSVKYYKEKWGLERSA